MEGVHLGMFFGLGCGFAGLAIIVSKTLLDISKSLKEISDDIKTIKDLNLRDRKII